MSKPKKLKLKEFIYKPLVIALVFVVILQVVILLGFLWGYNPNASIDFDDCYSKSVVVEEKRFIKGHRRIRGSVFYIVSGGESYTFSDTKYSETDLDEKIAIGETIDVHYIDSNGHFLVVNAKGQNEVYVDINEYNRESQISNVILIISFSIIEIGYLIVLAFYIKDSGIFAKSKNFYMTLKRKINKLKKD